jgi:hypothetical protein
MLRKTTDLEGYNIGASDGTIGQVKDFYFDDEAWVIRYLIVDTGAWLSSRQVLISPIAIGHTNWEEKVFPVSITKEQVKHSPDIDTHKPVSRQHESQYSEYYGYPNYWVGTAVWGQGAYPNMMLPGLGYSGPAAQSRRMQAQPVGAETQDMRRQGDPCLRSCKEVAKYHIHATDGDIGHVQSFLVDERTWAIRYLIVDTSNWWLGHQVLIAPEWIENVSWPDAKVAVDVARQALKDAPTYDPAARLDRNREAEIYKHYQRAGYWADEMRESATSRQ